MSGISVVVPVGPEQHHSQYLEECLDSLHLQTLRPQEILIIDDMAGLRGDVRVGEEDVDAVCQFWGGPFDGCRIWYAPWRLGVAAAFNCGVALARNNLVLMVGADDWLEPECLEACLEAFQKQEEDLLCYYYLSVRYHAEDGFEIPRDLEDGVQTLPCNAAMVSKQLWANTGGFPPETGSGAPDAALISILMVHAEAGKLIPVAEGNPLYNVRIHEGQDTCGRAPWQSVIIPTRNILTQLWKAPVWGRSSR